MYTIPNKNRTKCLKRFTVTITTNDPYGLIIIGSSSLGIIFTISILLLYTMKRKTPVVRSSNFSLSLMQLISHLIIFSLTCLFTGDNTITKCKIRTYGISFFLHSYNSFNFNEDYTHNENISNKSQTH